MCKKKKKWLPKMEPDSFEESKMASTEPAEVKSDHCPIKPWPTESILIMIVRYT